jgi:tRNA-Thr(GGU) m(6)t(6)A37 methyltransferase TsaA
MKLVESMDSELIEIGRVRNEFKEPSLRHRNGDLEMGERGIEPRKMVSELIIDPVFEEAMEGVEGFSHLTVVFWTGLRKTTELQVHPAGQMDIPLKGIFSTRSPARPNPLAITTVELLERKGNRLVVRGLDAIDGSMIVDIKPHLPGYDAPQRAELPDWMERIQSRFSMD